MKEMSGIERLALFQAFYNKIGKECSTSGGGLRSQADEHYRELYEQTGSKSFDVKLFGEPVGTYSVRFSKPVSGELVDELVVGDYVELAKWFDGISETYDIDMIKSFVAPNLAAYAEWYFEQTGECPPGTTYRTTAIPAQPKQYIGGVLRIDADKVADAIKPALPGVSQLLLGGGDES